jgi:hypothetical protein
MLAPKSIIMIAFAAVYIILTAVAWFSIHKTTVSSTNIRNARRAINGLMIMSIFAIGYVIGGHTFTGITVKWSTKDLVTIAVGVIILALALTAIVAINKTVPDVASVQRSTKGLALFSLVGAGVALMSARK